ncbi:MAG: hypothetical protein EA367_15375 [Leptolyngbya sp. DLM2.Bin15]|nr:MAG: hypothetical protein EA367_15375 [Leptolyngbya sp. DLM2.Bin15]
MAGNTIQDADTSTFSNIRPRATRVQNNVGPDDRDDFYRLRLTGRTSLEINMDRLQDNANLQLLNRRGNVIARSTRPGTRDEDINTTVNRGTYFLRVFTPNRRADTRYRLNVSGYDDNAGDNFNQALAIDPQAGNVNLRDYVGPADKNDFYSFSLDSFAEVDLSLATLGSNTRMILFDGDRNRITADARGSSGNSAGITEALAPGDYFVRVTPVGRNSATTYRFRATTGPFPDGAGDTFEDANNLGQLPSRSSTSPISTIEELLDVNDTDVYRFRTAANRGDANTLLNVSLNINTAGLDVDLELFDSSFQSVASNSGTNTVALSDVSLAANSIYYIQVSKVDNAAFSFFTLDLDTELDIIDQAGNTPAEAFNIDDEVSWAPVNGRRSFSIGDFVGADIDEDDYFRFSLTEASFINLNVLPDSDPDATADIQIFRQGPGGINDLILFDTVRQEGNVPEQVQGVFDAGTYFIRVFPEAESSFAFYEMSLEATSVSLTPAFIKDINPGPGSSSNAIQQMAGVGGSLFFAANDGTGVALWSTDGTFDGTQELRKFNTIGDMVSVNGFVYFTAADASLNIGQELWRTDGTAVELVKDIFPGEQSSGISNFTVVGDFLYFTATDQSNQFATNNEVWVVDTNFVGGNLANSATLLDVTGNDAGSNPSGLTAVGNSLYFFADDQDFGEQIFKSTAGGAPVAIDTGLVGPSGEFAEFNGALYFTGQDFGGGNTNNLYRLGANDIVEALDPIAGLQAANFGNLTSSGGKLFFTGSTTATGVELYAYDPTRAQGSQTYLVKDINVEPNAGASSNPQQLTSANGLLYFTANDDTGRHLWVSDGTEEGTTKVLFEDSPLLSAGNLTAVGSTLYFTADDGAAGSELWRISVGGQVELVDIAGDVASNPGNLTEVNGRLFFRANTPEAGRELWVVGLPEDQIV